MLTKDLIRFRRRKGLVVPQLVSVEDEALLETAEALLDLFRGATGLTREQIAVAAAEVVEASPCEAVVSRGIVKLLIDRADFDESPDEELTAKRAELFAHSARVLREGDLESLQTYREQVVAAAGPSGDPLEDRLYADLPPLQPLRRFRALSAPHLLHRYNAAQVQGLLLRAERVTLRLQSADAGALRQLLKYLRFFQLLSRVVRAGGDEVVLEIDGPMTLFVQARKYGMNLARFFPAVLLQDRWTLEAELQMGPGRSAPFVLDETCGIRSHLQHFLDYVPDEVRMLRDRVATELVGWELRDEVRLLPLSGEQWCCPDLLLRHEAGHEAAVELFHAWHRTPLTVRLEQVRGGVELPLLLGVSSALLKDEQIAAAVAESEYFARWGFTFRTTPTVSKIRPLLEQI